FRYSAHPPRSPPGEGPGPFAPHARRTSPFPKNTDLMAKTTRTRSTTARTRTTEGDASGGAATAEAPAKKGSRASKSGASTGRRGSGGREDRGIGISPSAVAGKQLVIVESPSKAKTINKYLGPGYVVLASVGHVRDLPSKARKGEKS